MNADFWDSCGDMDYEAVGGIRLPHQAGLVVYAGMDQAVAPRATSLHPPGPSFANMLRQMVSSLNSHRHACCGPIIHTNEVRTELSFWWEQCTAMSRAICHRTQQASNFRSVLVNYLLPDRSVHTFDAKKMTHTWMIDRHYDSTMTVLKKIFFVTSHKRKKKQSVVLYRITRIRFVQALNTHRSRPWKS